jgi:hypothetical protein
MPNPHRLIHKNQQQQSCRQLTQHSHANQPSTDVVVDILVLIADVAVQHQTVVYCELPYYLVVAGKFAVT